MAGKARSNSESFEAFMLDKVAKLENQSDQNSNITGSQFFITPPPQDSIKRFFQLGADNVLGGVTGYGAAKITIDTGAIDIGIASGKKSGFVILSAETGAADTLTDINNFSLQYQDLTLLAFTANTITITNTGNIDLTEDLILNDNQAVTLFYDILTDSWKVKGGIGDGGGGVSFPITPPVDIRGNVNTNQNIVLTDTDAHSTTLTLTGDIDITFSGYPTSGTQIEWEVEVTQDGTGGRVITWPAEVVNVPVLKTTPNTVTVVSLRTNDGGTTVRVGNTVTTTAAAGVTTLSDLTIDTAKNWLAFGISNLGGLTMSGDINVGTFDIQNIDRALFAVSDGTVTGNTVSQILLNTNNQFQFNTAKTKDFILSFDNNAALAFDHNETTSPDQRVLSLLSDSSDTAAVAFLRITHSAISPNDTQTIGALGFYGTDDAGGTGVLEYSAITGVMAETGTGAISGSMLFDVTIAGTSTPFLTLNAADDGQVTILKELDMQSNKIVALATPTSDNHAATKKYVDDTAGGANVNLSNLSSTAVNDTINMGSEAITFNPSGVLIASASSTQLNIQFPTLQEELRLVWNTDNTPVDAWEFTPSTLTGTNIILDNSFFLNNSAADPTANGEFQKNVNDVKVFSGGAVRNLSNVGVVSGGANVNLSNLSSTAINQSLIPSATDVRDLGTASLQWNDLYVAEIINSGTITITTGNDFRVDVVDDFVLRHNLSTKLTFNGDNDNFEFQTDILIDGENAIRSEDSAEIGFFVTNATSDVGTQGTNQVPTAASIASPTIDLLDTAFGSEIGCMGQFNTSALNVQWAIKSRADEWVTISITDGGNVVGNHINA